MQREDGQAATDLGRGLSEVGDWVTEDLAQRAERKK